MNTVEGKPVSTDIGKNLGTDGSEPSSELGFEPIGDTNFTQSAEQSEQQQLAWLRFVRDRTWSLRQKQALIRRLACPSEIYQHSIPELAKLISGAPNLRHASDSHALCEQLEQDLNWLQQSDCHLITITDKAYPTLLKNIYDPPIALFVKGDISCLRHPKIAMVGSRRPTPVGTKIAEQLARQLAELGIVVTSGMALGIDGAAHQGALDAESSTIAVWGCGLDIVYPSRHRSLAADIQAKGCLISEYPLGYAPSKYSFPQRNRVVSGLSLGVIIIEAAERSGTLVTARLAVEQNRELMVVPGSALSAQYAGSHRLIQQGAAVVTNVSDILDLLWLDLKNLESEKVADRESPESLLKQYEGDHSIAAETSNDMHNRDLILSNLGAEPSSMDEIIFTSRLTAAEVSAMLLMLEIEGLVKKSECGGYVSLA